jgi:N-acetylglucosaminyldiphosphoundecaprenol N-acetyl-beta-D-mannosaminyltransferase
MSFSGRDDSEEITLTTPGIESKLGEVKLTAKQLVVEQPSDRFEILGVRIWARSFSKAVDQVMSWLAHDGPPKLVTFTNVHMLTEAHQNPVLLERLRQMDLNCPDGMPLVWYGKLKGNPVTRVYGPEFMPALCAASASMGYRHFLYGGKTGIAEKAAAELKKEIPDLQIVGTYSPPFRDLTAEEDESVVRQINESGADIVWVCLGCPKQEHWIAEHRDRLKVRVLLAVGMAFDTISKELRWAPPRIRAAGLEWVYRLVTEPKRMAPRYFRSNPLFVYLILREFISGQKRRTIN